MFLLFLLYSLKEVKWVETDPVTIFHFTSPVVFIRRRNRILGLGQNLRKACHHILCDVQSSESWTTQLVGQRAGGWDKQKESRVEKSTGFTSESRRKCPNHAPQQISSALWERVWVKITGVVFSGFSKSSFLQLQIFQLWPVSRLWAGSSALSPTWSSRI